jgi:hypothetical protein
VARASGALNAALMDDAVAQAPVTVEADDLEADDGISDAPLVRLVNSLIFQAAEDGASDIHFEPQEDALVVRCRIDGVLHVAERIPLRLASGVTTRLKVLSNLDIAERRKPQDGRISLNASAGACSTSASRRCRRRGRVGDDAPLEQVARGSDARGARPLDDRAASSSDRRPTRRCSSPGRPVRSKIDELWRR